MGYCFISGTGNRGIHFSSGIFDGLELRNARKKFKCPMCKKTYCSGTRYIADPRIYLKICMFCYDDWADKSIQTLKYIEEKIIQNKKTIKDNKDKWLKESLAGAIKGNKEKAWWEK